MTGFESVIRPRGFRFSPQSGGSIFLFAFPRVSAAAFAPPLRSAAAEAGTDVEEDAVHEKQDVLVLRRRDVNGPEVSD